MKDKTLCKLLVVSIVLVLVASVVAVGASTMDKALNGTDYNGSDLNLVKLEATGDWLEPYHPPTASFIYIQWSPLIITFDAASSSNPDGTVER
ncbi:MAG: hypothetical protein KAT65_04350, partial [Methanophagales archaeon]|nr:hypothetical protein [Methanophagales archaeon]